MHIILVIGIGSFCHCYNILTNNIIAYNIVILPYVCNMVVLVYLYVSNTFKTEQNLITNTVTLAYYNIVCNLQGHTKLYY